MFHPDEIGDDDLFPLHQMKYFQSGPNPKTEPSELVVEWTNQHGCGINEPDNPNKLNCQIILQFMSCEKDRCDQGDVAGDILRDGTDLNDLRFNGGSR